MLETIPDVYVMLGGDVQHEWAERPEDPWVLIGTQDQLLSRALNRGYAMSRFQWPIHFGLLNNDCRWVVDEVQLMGPGLWTTAQLDWMRRKRFPTLFSCPTTWMSATIGTSFLKTSDRCDASMSDPPRSGITKDDELKAWERLRAKRPLEEVKLSGKKGAAEELADRVVQEHEAGTLSLVICNTVEIAQAIFRAIPDEKPKILLTSRFRPQDRRDHEKRLYEFEQQRKTAALNRERVPGDGLICVSTQVVEAGVDVSAHRLWFEAAPWPAVIQRLGRVNRDGLDDKARAYYWNTARKSRDRATGPYDLKDLEDGLELIRELACHSWKLTAREAIERVRSGPSKDLAERALEPKPAPLLRATDVYGLFSTDPDVHGGFTDVSQFVRGIESDADVTVFWRSWEGSKTAAPRELSGPPYDDSEGCTLPVGTLRDYLEREKATAYVWNDSRDRWDLLPPREIRPGMLLLLRSDTGGYDRNEGWTGRIKDRLVGAPPPGPLRAEDDDVRSEIGAWVPLDKHLEDARREASVLVKALGLRDDIATAVVEAAAHHDLGKAHPKWQEKLPSTSPQNGPFAKAPYQVRIQLCNDASPSSVLQFFSRLDRLQFRKLSTSAVDSELNVAVSRQLSQEEMRDLRAVRGVRHAELVPLRPGMRHEAASAIAMWAAHRAKRASFPALSVYLAASHHGKVRTYLRAWTPEGEDVFGVPRSPAALTFKGSWPMDFSIAADGMDGQWNGNWFVPTNHGWTALVHDLLGPLDPGNPVVLGAVPPGEPRGLGPFALAYLEALVRIADWRASANPSSSITP
jgi:CRISPR-associated endonuclease/helicase Cas3